HREIGEIVARIVERKKFVYLCTNALLLEKKLHLFQPSPYLTFSVHLDGDREHHDASVCQEGVYEKAVKAIQAVRRAGFRANINCTLFDGADPKNVADFFDAVMEIGAETITVSPGYAYERAPDQAHFLSRRKTKELFREIFRHGRGRRWRFSHSTLFLDFLAGNQRYHCTPWGNPTYNTFGWQRPCYLLGEGYAATFRELMEETDWERYGTGNYEKCANCMAHCGYEPTAVTDTLTHPLKALGVVLRGIRTEGPMAPEIPLNGARPAEYFYEEQVKQLSIELKRKELRAGERVTAA
ncbi:MAG: adenosyl-hopene transferase HpnH, partial [Nitrospinota bacterium]